jgi:threonine synthase
MTTCISDNVYNIALEGNFDDCQAMVKASFADQSFLPDGRQLVAVNSINWARIMSQIVYYFAAGLAVGAPDRKVSFSVPTGNFGDIYAGWLAKRMGLPVNQLVIATNCNDILHRFMCANRYEKHDLQHTLSPSMDIMVSSNFERALFDCYNRDGDAMNELMSKLNTEAVSVPDDVFANAREVFDSYAVDDASTVATISNVYKNGGYLLDPHTAIGVKAARACNRDHSVPMVTLGTAHPAKFPDAVKEAGYSEAPPLPAHMADLFEREERYTVLNNDLATVQKFIGERAR